ncbi:endonuclease V [Cellulomonas sp. NPDC055163]
MTLDPGARLGRYGVCDVHYPDAGGAVAALVVAEDPELSTVLSEHVAFVEHVAPYEPGAFFERELPALRAVLGGVDALDLLVVDGYADLDPEGRPGLGAHVHAELGVPVVGVAKTRFRAASHAIEVPRGTAARPLYVTAAGMPAELAAALVSAMAGPHRIPAALRRVDAIARRPELARDRHPVRDAGSPGGASTVEGIPT